MEGKMVRRKRGWVVGGRKRMRGRYGVKKEGGHPANLFLCFQNGEEEEGMRKEKGAAQVSGMMEK